MSCNRFLVIGYGNPLRGDDGVGQSVAERVASWQLAGVRSLAVHQLTPELVMELAEAETVIFVDAWIGAFDLETAAIRLEILQRTTPDDPAGHAMDPRTLLVLTELLENHQPQAYQLLIPAQQFEFSEEFSALTQRGMEQALATLKQLFALDQIDFFLQSNQCIDQGRLL
uniref:Hydrogenase maturation protease n=1 Tax=Cyanothece sp. (strain PCC 7425 / ATCC 29141) TaxID=395961 RepID=B8HQ64_CYAP4